MLLQKEIKWRTFSREWNWRILRQDSIENIVIVIFTQRKWYWRVDRFKMEILLWLSGSLSSYTYVLILIIVPCCIGKYYWALLKAPINVESESLLLCFTHPALTKSIICVSDFWQENEMTPMNTEGWTFWMFFFSNCVKNIPYSTHRSFASSRPLLEEKRVFFFHLT